jgi:hypothetical protein
MYFDECRQKTIEGGRSTIMRTGSTRPKAAPHRWLKQSFVPGANPLKISWQSVDKFPTLDANTPSSPRTLNPS